MPYFRDDNIGTMRYGLQDFAPTFGQSLDAAVDETIAGNPIPVALNLLDVQRASNNQADRLTAYDAESIIKDSGVRGLTVKDGQYTTEALNMLIERKRKEQIRNDVLGRTEYSLLGTPVRAAAMLGASVIDPLNIASAFVPVVGEARVASLIGRTAAGSLSRLGARAGIGAVEGLAGAAMIEPFLYAGRTQLQDDYAMSDSLLNLAFGTALGGGLHAVGGQVADAFRSSDPYARFSGLNVGQVQKVLDFERSITPGMSPSTIETAIADWTPGMREAAGFSLKRDVPDVATDAISREDFAKLSEQYPEQIIKSIIDRAASRSIQDAPFAKISELDAEGARRVAARELADTMRAELLPIAGERADAGQIANLKAELADISQQAASNADRFKELAKRYQGEGLSRKQSEAKARKEIADTEVELAGRKLAIEQKIESNAKAAQAEQQIAEIEKGNVPEQFAQRVNDRANQIMAQADIARSMQPAAHSIVSGATPEARQAAFRSAIAQAVSGRIPEVEPLIRGNPTFDQLKAIADRQASADSLAIGDAAYSRAASEQLKAAPKDDGLMVAEAELAKSMERIQELKQNLELGGMDQMETAKLMDALAPFDEAIIRSENYGKAARAAAVCGLRS